MVRELLHDQGVEYDEVVYSKETADAPWAGWAPVKTAGLADGTLPFGQLPRYTPAGGAPIVQTYAIMRALGRAHGLYGPDEATLVACDELMEGARDLRSAWSPVVYTHRLAPDAVAAFKADAAGDRAGRGAHLAHLEAFVAARGGPFATGPTLQIADYVLFELLEAIQHALPDFLTYSATPALRAFYAAFAARPRLAAYIASDAPARKYANGNLLG